MFYKFVPKKFQQDPFGIKLFHPNKQTDRQTDRRINRQTVTQNDRQIDKYSYIHIRTGNDFKCPLINTFHFITFALVTPFAKDKFYNDAKVLEVLPKFKKWPFSWLALMTSKRLTIFCPRRDLIILFALVYECPYFFSQV
jgi:hypothetical protein